MLPVTRLSLCYIQWSDSCAELGPSRPPAESLTVQCLPALVELSQAIFLRFSTTELATVGLRWLIMGIAAAHEAQQAAVAHRPTDRSPKTPMRMGSDATILALSSCSSVPGSCPRRANSRPPRTLIML